MDANDKIVLPFSRAPSTHNLCIICKKRRKLILIPALAKLRLFINHRILVTGKSRCCKRHLNGSYLKDVDASRINAVADTTSLGVPEITDLLNQLCECVKRGLLDFENPGSLSDTDYYRLTGLSGEQFNNLFSKVKSDIRNTSVRGARTCLAILLVKLRTGLSHSLLSTFFGIPSKKIGTSIHSARKAMMAKFVPVHLGFDHITRDEVIKNHTTDLAKNVFANGDDVAILVPDGTYVYIQKSSNYSFQRRTYSMHKGRTLVKPMMFVTTTGYILAVIGPYYCDGKNNDAGILDSLMKQAHSKLLEWLHPEDILVVDRGFRDSIATLQEYGLIAKMPSFLESGTQHDTISANRSRLVTKIRWVVESANGLLKTYKMLANVVPNTQIPYIGDYVSIVAAICNAYRPARVESTSEDAIIAERMLALSKKTNHLQKYIEDNKLVRKTVPWRKIEPTSLGDFPKLTLEELERITIGVYQIKQASSYTREHLAEDGNYTLYQHKEEADLLRMKLQSRHTSSKVYQLWIRYETGSFDPIRGWYCQCKNGARMVGCCAHIASVLWYLGYNRHCENAPQYSSDAYPNYLLDASAYDESESSVLAEEEAPDEDSEDSPGDDINEYSDEDAEENEEEHD